MDFASSIRRIFIFQSDRFCFLHNALEVSGILFRFRQGTYQAGLMVDPLYVINFFVSGIPMGFVITWVYLASDRSILAGMIFHFFVNFLQEKIAMTPETQAIPPGARGPWARPLSARTDAVPKTGQQT